MVVDYYETSPTKLKPRIEPQAQTRIKKETEKKTIPQKNKVNHRAIETKKNAKAIMGIVLFFGILFFICYRFALIDNSFAEKEKLKNKLADMQKVNAQLKVSIEQQMNINNIKQEAEERLGMQKLNNDQKVYVTLDKKDYTESSANTVIKDNEETWWDKFLKMLKINQ